MAASLRAAATRILRPAGQGLRRLVHTQEQSRSTPSLEGGDRAAQIQQKKEELYDLIARAQSKKVGLFYTAAQGDRLVLRILSTQIKPRPNDPQWRWITTAKKVTMCSSAAIVLGIAAFTLPDLATRPEYKPMK
ncbi:hypothetical protein CFC21_072997 [Triticum aestivum]|uniref:Uncharacterized protein n=2 Tax=Triticum aestivum TaxID=4565 RepID=A0A3B6LRK1_WHEAT|nr:uncharacterized protein LOC123116747 [Triticum aestivum]KAF7067079.1 hypothetical protein CFC21_072997 [Triticum aestivum]